MILRFNKTAYYAAYSKDEIREAGRFPALLHSRIEVFESKEKAHEFLDEFCDENRLARVDEIVEFEPVCFIKLQKILYTSMKTPEKAPDVEYVEITPEAYIKESAGTIVERAISNNLGRWEYETVTYKADTEFKVPEIKTRIIRRHGH